MKANSIRLHLGTVLAVAGFLGAGVTARGQGIKDTNPVIPLIVMDAVPLTDAIRNLARQANFQYMLDPKLSGPSLGPDGKIVPQSSVTFRWENVSAKEALRRLLAAHGLKIVENPAIPVARITGTNQPGTPFDGSLLGSDTNGVIPLLVMDEVPLHMALAQLARNAQLKVVIDSKVSGVSVGSDGKPVASTVLSIRWENLTARQALAAVCENYDLVLVKDSATDAIRIKCKD
jgi:hypothetical protein